MAWVAGYHNWNGERFGKSRPTWGEARAEMVDELDQRVMGYETNPSDGGNEDEIEALRYARGYFAGLEDGEEGCTDADGLTFVLIPERPSELADLDDEQVCEVTRPLFGPGQLVATPGAIEVMERLGIAPLALLGRHVSGDWGDIDPEDKGLNEAALETGARIFSVYGRGEDCLWVITEAADESAKAARSATTILRPEDY